MSYCRPLSSPWRKRYDALEQRTIAGIHVSQVRQCDEEALMNLLLNSEEEDLVRELLTEKQRVLIGEISRAEHLDFKRSLQRKETLLESLLTKLTPAKITKS
jgi:hypothetical protein